MERRTLIKALLMLTYVICGMKTIATENRWDNLIKTEISAEKEKSITNFEPKAPENNDLKK